MQLTLQGPAHPMSSEHLPGQAWHSPAGLETSPRGLTCVILMTSLTNAMAFSGWNLQVPFCADRKE